MEQITNSGNDYLIAVKKNQPKLYEWIQTQFQHSPPDSIADDFEHTRDRTTQRTVSVLEASPGLDAAWVGVQRLIRVERTGIRGTERGHETMFYFSSLATDAAELSSRIREHWHIENRLRYPKDVVMAEDAAPLCDGYAPANFAILRTIALNLFRLQGFVSITKGIRHLGHDVAQLFSFFQ